MLYSCFPPSLCFNHPHILYIQLLYITVLKDRACFMMKDMASIKCYSLNKTKYQQNIIISHRAAFTASSTSWLDSLLFHHVTCLSFLPISTVICKFEVCIFLARRLSAGGKLCTPLRLQLLSRFTALQSDSQGGGIWDGGPRGHNVTAVLWREALDILYAGIENLSASSENSWVWKPLDVRSPMLT